MKHSSSRAAEQMVDTVALTVRDERVLEAMRAVPRDRFVPRRLRRLAFGDGALPIGEEQTISQPTIVGMMTEALALTGDEQVLEIGTGSGYQAAVLARLARDVVTVEVYDSLRERAAETLEALGVTNVRCLPAGPELGAPQFAPYDAIIVTAAASEVPPALLAQLRIGGRMAVPVGTRFSQELLAVTRTVDGYTQRTLGGCRFVPLAGPSGFVPPPHHAEHHAEDA